MTALSEEDEENCDERDYDDDDEANRGDCEYYDDGDEPQDNGGDKFIDRHDLLR